MQPTRKDTVTATVEVIKQTLGLFVMHPDKLEISCPFDSDSLVVTLEISCHPGDARRVVGTGGNHYRALGVLAKTVGGRLGIRIDLLPLDIESRDEQYPRFQLERDWPRQKVEGLLDDILRYCFGDAFETVVKDHSTATMYDVTVWDETAPVKLVEKLSGALQTLFRSIGKKQGWNLIVSLNAKKSLPQGNRGN